MQCQYKDYVLRYESEQMGAGTPREIKLCYRIDKLLMVVTLRTCKIINIFTPKMNVHAAVLLN